MKKKGEKVRQRIVKEFTVDPYAGGAALALGGAPKGYVFEKMERRGKTMKVHYVTHKAAP